MLKNKRLVSFIAMLAICFSFLVPAFVAPDQATASSTYTPLSQPTVGAGAATALGAVEIYVPSLGAFVQDYEVLTVSLPTGVQMYGYTAPTTITDPNNNDLMITTDALKIEFPATVDSADNGFNDSSIEIKLTSSCTFDIIAKKANFQKDTNGDGETYAEAGKMRIYFNKFNTTGYSGDITASFVAPLSGNGFTTGSAIIGRVSTTEGTAAYAKSVKTVSKALNQTIDTIVIAETALGSFTSGEYIKLKLPSGYEWVDDPTNSFIGGSWGFQNQSSGLPNTTLGFKYSVNGRELTITKLGGISGMYNDPDPLKKLAAYTDGYQNQTGRVNVGLEVGSIGLFKINVPDSAANGDVICEVSGSEGITEQEIVIAKVGDYGITVSEGDKTEVTSGKKDQKLGSFYIEESLKGSLVDKRTVKLTLPDGCKWEKAPSIEVASTSGTNVLGTGVPSTDKDYVVYTVQGSTSEATKLKLKDGKIQISPAFSGPVKLTISGTAGVSGEVTVAECLPVVTMTADASKNLIIGLPNQVASDITITEGKKGAIMDSSDLKYKSFKISLPSGVTFSSLPTVKVAEGNLDIDTYKLTDTDSALEVKVKYSSTTASKIVISDVKLTLDRTVPEGQLKAKLSTYGDEKANTYALDETDLFSTRSGAGSVVIGTCVTPAPANQGRSALFTIGSNIATMNGSYVIMDAAPYIKASRTYVPVRYLADALGATTQWDPATQTATLTLGDKSVVLVIGSKVEKVNGADVTMDVAPEIVNGRTMLPARYVAEGLGYQVGWNAATKQVIIQ